MLSRVNISSLRCNRTVAAGLVASLLIAFSGAAMAESWDEHKANRNYDEAVDYMNKGYAEIGKVVNKLSEDKDKSAMRHFNSAIRYFNESIEHYAKAALPASDKGAIEAMKKGLDSLEKATKAMEKNDVANAQSNYDAAQNYFAQAAALLD